MKKNKRYPIGIPYVLVSSFFWQSSRVDTKKLVLWVTLIVHVLSTSDSFSQRKTKKQKNANYTRYIDPLIGSAEHGHVFVGANVPFGAVQLGPVNVFEGWDWCSGYNYASNTILGFTHTHLSGTGIGDLSDVLLLPVTGKVPLYKGTKEAMETGYGSYFSHKKEVTKAGYYSVWLDKYKIKVELTASERVGFHKYTFPSVTDTHILLDLADGLGWDQPTNTFIKKTGAQLLVGHRHSKGWAADQRLFFAIAFSEPIEDFFLYDDQTAIEGEVAEGLKMKAILDFKPNRKKQILVKVGISPVSYENALANIHAEIPHWDFDQVVKEANGKWNKESAKIHIEATKEIKKVFYTAMYHTLFAPSLFNDANHDYRGTDKKVYPKADFDNYTTFSLWDTYRALHPLFTLTQYDRVNDMVKSFLAIYEQQGRLPIWHLMGNETYTMNGNHSIVVMVDAYQKGFRDYDVALAYQALVKTAMGKKSGNDAKAIRPVVVAPDRNQKIVGQQGVVFPYEEEDKTTVHVREELNYVQKLQYIPADRFLEAVGNALEYAIDDWCVAQMAKLLGNEAHYDYFMKRSKLYQLYFDKGTGFMRGKLADGSWREPFNPLASSHRKDDYVEGNAWQYTWLVPHDPYGLIELFGGDEPFIAKLDALFLLDEKVEGEDVSPDISGLIGQYAQGNEPNHHIPYLYAFAGQPWKTAKLIREIAAKFYTSQPDGICGNEDLGQMSAWYIYSAMGFYPVNPANGIYVMGTPLVNQATINNKNGTSFTVKAINRSHTHIYIQKMEYNGQPYTKSYITHDMIVNGGEIKIYMGSTPSATWGVKKEDRPL